MSMIRQTVLIRTDLGFCQGLMAAQVAHIHMETLRQRILRNDEASMVAGAQLEALMSDSGEANTFLEWLKQPYIFVHGVPNLEALEHYEKKADGVIGLSTSIWRDTVRISLSENQKIDLPNIKVGLSFGPADSDIIRTIIGDLPLLS